MKMPRTRLVTCNKGHKTFSVLDFIRIGKILKRTARQKKNLKKCLRTESCTIYIYVPNISDTYIVVIMN